MTIDLRQKLLNKCLLIFDHEGSTCIGPRHDTKVLLALYYNVILNIVWGLLVKCQKEW